MAQNPHWDCSGNAGDPRYRGDKQRIHPCRLICSIRPLRIMTSRVSQRMVSRTRAYAMMRSRCIMAYAVIPQCKNAKMRRPDTPRARASNEAVQSSTYLGCAMWRQVTGCQRRSRFQTKPLGSYCALSCRSIDASCETTWPTFLRT